MKNLNIESEILSAIERIEEMLIHSLDPVKKAVYETRIKQSSARKLEDIGNEFNISRERVRQKEDELRVELKKLINKELNIEQAINALFSEYGKLLPIGLSEITDKDRNALEGYFQNDYTFYIDAQAGVITSDKEVLERLYENILSSFVADDIHSWSNAEISSLIESRIKKLLFKQSNPEVINELVANVLHYILDNYFVDLSPLEPTNYLLKGGDKRTDARKLEYFFKKQYRLGVSIPLIKDEEIESNLARLKEALPDLNMKPRPLRNKIVAMEKVITWNDGTYIHLDNCSIDEDIIEDVIQKSVELFELGVQSFEAREFFDLYARKLVAKGLPNHIALYSLLEHQNDERIKLVENKRTLLTITDPKIDKVVETFEIPKDFFNQEELLTYPKAETDFRTRKSEACEADSENSELDDTERDTIIRSRITQGKFRTDLLAKYSHKCILCEVQEKELLRASHIKPWSASKLSPTERNDVENGFLLCTWHDALFDKGYISFDDDGSVIISAELENNNFSLLNIDVTQKIKLSHRNKTYLKHHREANAKKLVPFIRH